MVHVGHIVETEEGIKGIVTRKFAGINLMFSDGSFGYRTASELKVVGYADIKELFRQIEKANGYMEYLLTIPGTLNNLNNYIAAERTNRHKGAKMKADNEKIVIVAIRQCMMGVRIEKPVFMEYTWFEPSRRRDKDNISSFGRKVIQDALVDTGVLKDDGWKYVVGFSDRFEVDKNNPRIEIKIKEVVG